MSDWIIWIIFAALLLILIGRTVPLISDEFRISRDRWRHKHGEPIDWTNEHNMKLPLSPYFDPRVEFTEEEAFIDLLEENARLLKELEEKDKLQQELEHQKSLKNRYRKALNRVQRRG